MPERFPPIGISPDTRQDVEVHRRLMADLIPEFDRAERCGINCGQWRKHHRQLTGNMDAVLTEYPSRNPGE